MNDPIARGALESLAQGAHNNPFAVLGPHDDGDKVIVRVFAPGAHSVCLVAVDGDLLGEARRLHDAGIFSARIAKDVSYRLRIQWADAVQETEDPYAFGTLLSDRDIQMVREGNHPELYRVLGAHCENLDGTEGVRFAVWAPNASRVSVAGDFNNWDGRRHPMRLRHDAGVWELFIPRIGAGTVYKYEVRTSHGGILPLKADPYARQTQLPPQTASIVASNTPFAWTDAEWLATRLTKSVPCAPVSIYEVHAASWKRPWSGSKEHDWNEFGDQLIPYLQDMGFTHVELMPVMEHPFGGSWGYQPLGMFAPTARHGSPADFARFVDRCHEAGIGVILDWVPGHFPSDSYGLAQFDGTALYEYADSREGFHRDWNTLIYNFARTEVAAFLLASALSWLDRYHIDGLRIDAVSSMLYRDYSREPGEWVPNVHGGRENLEAIAFLQRLNHMVRERYPGVMVVAEESTAWPGVTAPENEGGLGFHYKWNMGWMHDTLRYMSREPVHRSHHHSDLSFSFHYLWSEKFILALSHDEVVHGKGSLLSRMPGDKWQAFANLRAYFGFMFGHPGKKLLFMGDEFGQADEWREHTALDWHLLQDPYHEGVQRLVRDLNRVYRTERSLHVRDLRADGFFWLVGDDCANSVFAFGRRGEDGDPPIVVVSNFTPVPRHHYRLGVPHGGVWRELVNTDSGYYSGSNVGNLGEHAAEAVPSHGQGHSLSISLPPLSTLILKPV